MTNYTPKDLIDFEEEVKKVYNEGKIKAPVHLSGGNEVQLIKIFKQITRYDWVFSCHRSHYHALLKGIPRDWLMNEILAGHSIHIENREHRFVTSAIVGGCLPIAVGVAMAMKMKHDTNRVWVFIGDMASHMGVFHECYEYSSRNYLPITFVVEDNQFSTNSPTEFTWGIDGRRSPIIRYVYARTMPHIGTGTWVPFS